jgi:hypothetical protein
MVRCQTRDIGCRVPDMMTLAFNVMTTTSLVKTTMHPAAASSWPMNTKEWVRSGSIRQSHAWRGKAGRMCNSVVCVECMMVTVATWTGMGSVANCLLMTGALTTTKVLVAQVSATRMSSMVVKDDGREQLTGAAIAE